MARMNRNKSFGAGLLGALGLAAALGLWFTPPKAAKPLPLPQVPGQAQAQRPALQLDPAVALRRTSGRPDLTVRPMPGAGRGQEDPADVLEAIASAVHEGDERPAGMVDKEQIRRAVAAMRPLLAECFSDLRGGHQGRQELVLRFKVGVRPGALGHGQVLRSTVADPWLEACAKDSVEDARFEPTATSQPVTVTWPFRYEAPRAMVPVAP
jgi:hypothetical protein